MRIFYTLFFMLLRRRSSRPQNKLKQNPATKIKVKNWESELPIFKVKNWESELPIFKKNMAKYVKILRFTKSPQTMIKTFSSIKEEFGKILAYKYSNIDLAFDGQTINSIEDLYKIDIIQDKYIKEFLNTQINIELEKEKEVNQSFLKESLIKKALNQSLKSIEYIPNDVEMRLRITELEDKLTNCYNGGNSNE